MDPKPDRSHSGLRKLLPDNSCAIYSVSTLVAQDLRFHPEQTPEVWPASPCCRQQRLHAGFHADPGASSGAEVCRLSHVAADACLICPLFPECVGEQPGGRGPGRAALSSHPQPGTRRKTGEAGDKAVVSSCASLAHCALYCLRPGSPVFTVGPVCFSHAGHRLSSCGQHNG